MSNEGIYTYFHQKSLDPYSHHLAKLYKLIHIINVAISSSDNTATANEWHFSTWKFAFANDGLTGILTTPTMIFDLIWWATCCQPADNHTTEMAHDFVFRFVLLGDTRVGKTRMIQKYTQGDAQIATRSIATISLDFYTQSVTTVDGLTVKVKVKLKGQQRLCNL